MSEIQSFANPDLIKWVLGGLVGFVNFLMIYIFRNFEKKFDKLSDRSDIDHDRLGRVEAEHRTLHKEEE